MTNVMMVRFAVLCGLYLLSVSVRAADEPETAAMPDAATINAPSNAQTIGVAMHEDGCALCTEGELDLIKVERADALATRLLALFEKLEKLKAHQGAIEQLSKLNLDASTQEINTLLASMVMAQRVKEVKAAPTVKEAPPKPKGLTGLVPAYAEAGRGSRQAQAAVVSHGNPIPLPVPGATFVHNGTQYAFVGVERDEPNGDLFVVLSQGNQRIALRWHP